MIPAGRVKGSWVGGQLPVSFFVLFFFSIFSSSPMSASIAGNGVEFRPLYLDPFLAMVCADPTVVEVGSRIINK